MSKLAAESVSVIRGGRLILNQVSITVGPGDFLAVVGPNGSGKSTLLRALAGLWSLAKGMVTLDGRPLSDMPRRELAKLLAFVPQDIRMDFAFTVEEIVAMGRYPHRGRFVRPSNADHHAIDRAIEQCDIGHLRTRLVTTLSGGERQRVAIARSLAVEPEMILLDEPTANLDVQHTLEVLELCQALSRAGKSVVLATHDLNAVTRYSQSVVLIDSGQVAYSGDRDGVLTTDVIEAVFGVGAERLNSAAGHQVFLFHKRREQS